MKEADKSTIRRGTEVSAMRESYRLSTRSDGLVGLEE